MAREHAGRLAAAVCLLTSLPASAQAWLPPKGEFTAALSYNDLLNKHHYDSTGQEIDVGHTDSETTGLSLAWAPADRFLLNASIPYVQTLWRGAGNHGPEVDTGHVHSSLTDLRVELHYQWLQFPVAVAPFVALVLPVTDYPVLGHSAPGRGLTEQWLGFFAGRSSEAWLPGAFVQIRYNYSFVQEVADISHDRSNLDLEVGYFLTQAFMVTLAGSRQWAHGGVDVPMPPSNPLFPYHDQLAAAEFLNVTGALAWFPNERSSVSLSYSQSVWGKNAHKVDHSVTFSLGYRIPAP